MRSRSRWRLVAGLTAAGVCLVVGLAHSQPAAAARVANTLTVTTTVDELDGIGSENGQCSLREAIQSINVQASIGGCPTGAPGDTILLAAGATYSLTLAGADEDGNATGDLDPAITMTIRPASGRATITAGLTDRMFDIQPGAAVTLEDVTLTGGYVLGQLNSNGGAIHNEAVLTLTRVDLYGNSAASGGAIYNGSASALVNIRVVLTIVASNLYSNAALSSGGGLYNYARAALLESSVISNTVSSGGAGGVFNEGDLSLRNVTVSHNTASVAGGIYNSNSLALNNVTVAGNSAQIQGGGMQNLASNVTAANTLIADNHVGLGNGPDCYDISFNRSARPESLGYLLIGVMDAESCQFNGATSTIYTTTDPLLGPLALNGARTYTHALLAGSPALDRGSPAAPTGSPACEATDQRGVARLGLCDIGAYDTAQLLNIFLPLLFR